MLSFFLKRVFPLLLIILGFFSPYRYIVVSIIFSVAYLCLFFFGAQRAANTGWGPQDNSSRWGNDKFEGSKKSEKSFGMQERAVQEGFPSARGDEKALIEKSDGREGKRSRRYDDRDVRPTSREGYNRREEKRSTRENDDDRFRSDEKRSRRHNDSNFEPRSGEDHYRRDEKRSKRHGDDEYESRPNRDYERREQKKSPRNESESYGRQYRDKRSGEK